MPRTSKKILSLLPPIQKIIHTASLWDSDRLKPQSQPVSDSTDHSVCQDTEQPREEYPNHYRPQLEDIPELEDDE